MKSRINDKIKEVEEYLSELSDIEPEDFGEYLDIKTKAACERYFEKIIESAVDLSFLVIKDNSFRSPEKDKESFNILFSQGIISKELAERLSDAKGMRNIIAHEYGTVDDEKVYHAISEELEFDVKNFIKSIREHYKKI